MNYELAKALQNARWIYKDGSRSVGETATPTLSELIEACGDAFDSLVRVAITDHLGGGNIIKWRAQARDPQTPDGRASTPEEAVARLWLSLNKKPRD